MVENTPGQADKVWHFCWYGHSGPTYEHNPAFVPNVEEAIWYTGFFRQEAHESTRTVTMFEGL